jgi:hypothetical protein
VQFTRSWLADALDAEQRSLASGMAKWLRAQRPGDYASPRRVVRSDAVLARLGSWLRSEAATGPALIPELLPDARTAALAGRFVDEFLKTEGLLDLLPRPERREVSDALAEFFAGGAQDAQSAGPGPGTNDQMKSAVQGPTAPRLE